MFCCDLTAQEIQMIGLIEEFVREKHASCEGHDYSHVLQVTKNAIEIANIIDEPVDPFVLICGALFHDLGRVGTDSGVLHGIRGAALVEQFLKASWVDKATGKRIEGIIVRHSPTSHMPPKSIEEKIVYDADTLDRFGWIGIIRGIMGKKGSIEQIVEGIIAKRSNDYDSLILPASRQLGKKAHQNTLFFLNELREEMKQRLKEIRELNVPKSSLIVGSK